MKISDGITYQLYCCPKSIKAFNTEYTEPSDVNGPQSTTEKIKDTSTAKAAKLRKVKHRKDHYPLTCPLLWERDFCEIGCKDPCCPG